MNPDFSEFSYGYAVTEELVASLKASIVGAPIFPSLYEEGKIGGYDVKIPLIGKPVFLQFKLSSYLERNNSKEHRNGTLAVPYYRMHLRPKKHSDQHQLLFDLECAGESVFYIAPEFHLPSELNEFYLNKSVIENSAAFSPKDIGELDDEEHYVVFKRGTPIGYICSDNPLEIQKTYLTKRIENLLEQRDINTRKLDEEGLRTISEKMIKILKEQSRSSSKHERKKPFDIDGIRRIISNRPIAESVGYIARTFFDAELFIF